jgi:hypothetical protein
MDSALPKVLIPLAGKLIISYPVKSIALSGINKQPITFVSPENKNQRPNIGR